MFTYFFAFFAAQDITLNSFVRSWLRNRNFVKQETFSQKLPIEHNLPVSKQLLRYDPTGYVSTTLLLTFLNFFIIILYLIDLFCIVDLVESRSVLMMLFEYPAQMLISRSIRKIRYSFCDHSSK
jgi:hypothetical protein